MYTPQSPPPTWASKPDWEPSTASSTPSPNTTRPNSSQATTTSKAWKRSHSSEPAFEHLRSSPLGCRRFINDNMLEGDLLPGEEEEVQRIRSGTMRSPMF